MPKDMSLVKLEEGESDNSMLIRPRIQPGAS